MTLKDRPVLLGGALGVILLGVLVFSDSPESSLLQRTVNRDPNRLSRGTPAPDFHLPTAQGGVLGLEQLRGAPSVLVFVSPTCPHCKKLKEDLLDQGLPELDNRLVFVSRGNGDLQEYPPEIQRLEARLATLVPILQDSAGTVFEAYKVQGVPTAYRLGEKGEIKVIQVGAPGSLELVQRLVEENLSSRNRAGL